MSKIKRLPTRQYLRECFAYDPATGSLTWKRRPPEHFSNAYGSARNLRWAGKRAGTVNAYGHVRVRLDGIDHYAARVIWKLTHGREPSTHLSAINGNQQDLRLCNLQLGRRKRA